MTAVLGAPATSYNNESLGCAASVAPNLGKRISLSAQPNVFEYNEALTEGDRVWLILAQ